LATSPGKSGGSQGFDIEGLRIEDEAPLSNLVMAAFVAAVIVQQLVHARDGALLVAPHPAAACAPSRTPSSDRPLLEAFCAKLEGNTARQKNPHPKRSLAYAAWVCAASAVGPATTASQARSSCSTASNSSKPPPARAIESAHSNVRQVPAPLIRCSDRDQDRVSECVMARVETKAM
jgi:hypothetical protein